MPGPQGWGDARPRRLLEWREEDARCVLLRPRLGTGRLGRWLAARFDDPYYRIRLDEMGSLVWRACDGETPLWQIAVQMREHFGDRVEPVERRLGQFIGRMVKARILEI